MSASQRQKFHTDDANQCLLNKSDSHGVPNVNLFNFRFLLVDFDKVLFSSGSTKTWNPETESRKRNTESNINDGKLKNFTLHNLVQSKENLF